MVLSRSPRIFSVSLHNHLRVLQYFPAELNSEATKERTRKGGDSSAEDGLKDDSMENMSETVGVEEVLRNFWSEPVGCEERPPFSVMPAHFEIQGFNYT